VDVTTSLHKFYTAATSICSHTIYASKVTKLFFVESYCLRLITHGREALNFNSHIIHQLSVCWNNAYRRIFYYNSCESVKALQFYCGRLDFYHVYVKRKLTFLRALCELDSLVACRKLSSAFNCTIDIFSVVELN